MIYPFILWVLGGGFGSVGCCAVVIIHFPVAAVSSSFDGLVLF